MFAKGACNAVAQEEILEPGIGEVGVLMAVENSGEVYKKTCSMKMLLPVQRSSYSLCTRPVAHWAQSSYFDDFGNS